MPHELDLFGVFVPPFLPLFFLSIIATILTAALFNRFRLSRYFMWPELVVVAFVIIYMCLFSVLLPGI